MNFVEPIRARKKIAQIKNLLRGQRRYRDLLLFVVGINTALRISDLLQLRIVHLVDDQQHIKRRFWIREQKRGNCENYIKEAKYDMAVGRLLLKSFWSYEAIFQLMMLAYNLFLLFKIDFLGTTEYRQQIKTFCLKYIFLAGKIIRTARSVVMKLSEKYPYREIYEKSLS